MTIITFTKPMSEFSSYFANGSDVAQSIDLSQCTQFYPSWSGEAMIYTGSQIVFSCIYTEYNGKMYITSVWTTSGCIYEYDIDYSS